MTKFLTATSSKQYRKKKIYIYKWKLFNCLRVINHTHYPHSHWNETLGEETYTRTHTHTHINIPIKYSNIHKLKGWKNQGCL